MFFQVKPIKLKHTVSLRLVLILFFLIIGLAPMMIQNKIMLGTYRQNQIDARIQDIQNQLSLIHI